MNQCGETVSESKHVVLFNSLSAVVSVVSAVLLTWHEQKSAGICQGSAGSNVQAMLVWGEAEY